MILLNREYLYDGKIVIPLSVSDGLVFVRSKGKLESNYIDIDEFIKKIDTPKTTIPKLKYVKESNIIKNDIETINKPKKPQKEEKKKVNNSENGKTILDKISENKKPKIQKKENKDNKKDTISIEKNDIFSDDYAIDNF